MKKICIDLRMWNSSGIGTYLQKVIPKLIQEMKNIDFVLIIKTEDNKKIKRLNLKAKIITSSAKIYSIYEQVWMIYAIKNIRPDLFWSPHYNIPIFYFGKKIVTIHDVYHLAHIKEISFIKRIYAKLLFFFIKNTCAKVITDSEFSKEEIIKYAKIFSGKIKVIHLGAEQSITSRNEKKKNIILSVGNIKTHKNLKTLINAFKLIKDQISHQLVIVGEKENLISYDKGIEFENNDHRIQFTGFISKEELIKYYQSCDVFVFPSLYEGFGLPPLEAMSYGSPVIVSNAASLPEVCGDAAIYFNPQDADNLAAKILQLSRDNVLKNKMIILGKERIKHFGWNNTVENTQKIIEEVMNDNRQV